MSLIKIYPRDSALRVFSTLAGWGGVVFTANGMGWYSVYILAPIMGGQSASLIFRFF